MVQEVTDPELLLQLNGEASPAQTTAKPKPARKIAPSDEAAFNAKFGFKGDEGLAPMRTTAPDFVGISKDAAGRETLVNPARALNGVAGYPEMAPPNEVTDPALLQQLNGAASTPSASSTAASGAPSKTRTWGSIPLEALSSTPKSAGNVASGFYNMVRHPIDTGLGLWDTAAGGLRNALPDSVVNFVEGSKPSAAALRANDTADAVGRYHANRYGNMEGFKQALATDPIGVLSDLSMVFTGGAGLAAKMPTINKALTTAANVTNPINIVGKAASKVVPVIGNTAATLSGTLGTHTGALPLQQATKSGYEGAQSARDFADNLRGKVPMTDVLNDAKANLENMARAKSEAYRNGMAQVSGDQSILKFNRIDSALSDSIEIATFKGQIKNQRAAEVLLKIGDEIAVWKTLKPSEFHTPEGLDALKQKVGAIVESIPFEEKTARLVGTKIRDSIKSEIARQAPVYNNVMKDYYQASNQIEEIERTLSLNKGASIDTAMRKLQSLTRNNVNTNFGNRVNLAKQLEGQGGIALMPALAGQALNTWTPRGIGGNFAGGITLGAGALGGLGGIAGALVGQSPRLAGEVAYKIGQSRRLLENTSDLVNRSSGGLNPSELANLFSQAGLLNQR